ncbi:MAG: dTDP-4-dehydrorhamnose reductase [Thermodesulfobacteriota bacterium]|nr:dTDP-4-dehydrorhamnose reductase [Thermodesulfobacteriota bacterium]
MYFFKHLTLKEKNIKILVTGSEGQLGWEIQRQGKLFGFEIIGVDLPQIDITDIIQMKKAISDYQPVLLINAAAYTNVDKAESEPDLAFAVNRDGPDNLAGACANAKLPFIHISTDYVFNGQKKSPYIETDQVSPLGVYGKSKEQGEKRVRFQTNEHIILRTSWMYGVHGNNFVKTMLRLGRERKTIKVVSDQYGSPTSAADHAEAVLTIADLIISAPRINSKINWGTYHYCGQGITTWYEFAEAVFDIAARHEAMKLKRIEPIKTIDYPTPAKRPFFSGLDCSLIEKSFGIKAKPWQESLKLTIDRIFAQN